MNIKKMIKSAHDTAIKKGWWDEKRDLYEIMALIHSEISEVVEEARNDRPLVYYMIKNSDGEFEIVEGYSKKHKPEGQLIELADACIRIFDFIGVGCVDIHIDKYKTYSTEFITHRTHNIVSFCGHIHRILETSSLVAVIRQIEIWCDSKGWNLEEAILKKMEYNKTRPHRHGGKKY